jgi:hypothetical protein
MIPRGKLAAGLGLQAALFVTAGAAMWVYSGRELSGFIDFRWWPVMQGIAFGLGLIALAAAVFMAFPRFLAHTTGLQSHMAPLFTERSDWRVYVFIALCAGIGEEALFRGGLMTLLQDSVGPVAAILLSALAFALFHLAKPLIGAIIVLIGVIFGVVYWWTGSLMTAMIGHAVYDVWALHVLHRELHRLGYLSLATSGPAISAGDHASGTSA